MKCILLLNGDWRKRRPLKWKVQLSTNPSEEEHHNNGDHNNDDDINPKEAWEEYCRNVQKYQKGRKTLSKVGLFSKSIEQRFYDQCCQCPIPPLALQQIPILKLPLRIHLARTDTSDDIGCSHALKEHSVRTIVDQMNEYWVQAGIFFHLAQIQEYQPIRTSTSTTKPLSLNERRFIQSYLTETFKRGDRQHRNLFLSTLLPHTLHNDAYDIYFFDNIGNTLQGVCIDRPTHTIIMGERSTKGYDTWTCRPYSCLAKTMAHELGHALGLNHPKNRVFDDGRPQTLTAGERNLMTGGLDVRGGGGWFLEQWQICVTRKYACEFLDEWGFERGRETESRRTNK